VDESSSSPTRSYAIFSDDENILASSPPSSPNQPLTDAVVAKLSHGDDAKLEAWDEKVKQRAKAGVQRGHDSAYAPPAKEECLTRFMAKVKASRSTAKAISKAKPKQLTQMRLDLGQTIHKRCQTCGMEYRPSVQEDKKLHDRFHAKSMEGIVINHKLCRNLRLLEDEEKLDGQDIVLSLPDPGFGGGLVGAQKMFQNVLDVVEIELGGVGIPADQLWSKIEIPRHGAEPKGSDSKVEDQGAPSISTTTAPQITKEERYKPYIFVRGDKVLGACLAERIFEAYPVLPDSRPPNSDSSKTTALQQTPNTTSSTPSSALRVSSVEQPATMGISRIWVSNQARGQGIAMYLLDFAAKRFIYHFKIPKTQIAFSQPTQAGAGLARKWFGKEDGWVVYGG
jgi:N-acetyltransferase